MDDAHQIFDQAVEQWMGTLYLTEQYSLVKREGEALRVHIPARNGAAARVARVPLIKVDQVVVFGDITLTAPAMHMLLGQRIAIHFLSERGKSYGSLIPDPTKNAKLHLAQYATHALLPRRFPIARAMIDGKLGNMRTLLLRHNRKLESSAVEEAASALRTTRRQLNALSVPHEARTDDRMNGLGDLLGLEGSGSAAYFGVFGAVLRAGWSFPGRVRRPPTDPVNALLSFGYTVLTNQVVSLICAVGLNPYIGMLHQPGYGKPALALDLVEEFRPIIVDSVVVTMLNNRMIDENDFDVDLGAYRLKDGPRRVFLEQIEARLSETIQHPLFGYKTTYRRAIELQVRLLAKTLMGEIVTYVPFTVR